MVGAKLDKATICRDMVSMEQDQAANNEVGGIQQRRNPQHKQLQQQREPEKETRLHCSSGANRWNN